MSYRRLSEPLRGMTRLGFVAAAVLVPACSSSDGGDNGPVAPGSAVASIQFTQPPLMLVVNDTLKLDLVLRDATGNALAGRAVTWSSQSPNVATVSAQGVLRGVAQGRTRITAASEGKEAQFDVNVVVIEMSVDRLASGTLAFTSD